MPLVFTSYYSSLYADDPSMPLRGLGHPPVLFKITAHQYCRPACRESNIECHRQAFTTKPPGSQHCFPLLCTTVCNSKGSVRDKCIVLKKTSLLFLVHHTGTWIMAGHGYCYSQLIFLCIQFLKYETLNFYEKKTSFQQSELKKLTSMYIYCRTSPCVPSFTYAVLCFVIRQKA